MTTRNRVSPSELLDFLYRNPTLTVAVDTETRPRKDRYAELNENPKLKLGILGVADGRAICMGVSLTVRQGDELYSTYVALNHNLGGNDDLGTWKKLRYVLQQEGRVLAFANAQFDFLSLETVHIRVSEQPFYDITTMANIARPWHPYVKSLEALSQAYAGGDGKVKEWEYVRLNDKGTPIKETTLKWQKENGWPHTTRTMIEEYACVDTEETLLVLEALLEYRGWTCQPESVWPEKQRTIRTLTEMKRRGIEVDVDLAHELEIEGTAALARQIETLGGLNPKSTVDAPKIFLEKLGLPVLRMTEGGKDKDPEKQKPSFTSAVLEDYDLIIDQRIEAGTAAPGLLEAMQAVRAYRGWSTALGLLLRPYQQRVSPDGRLRTSYTTEVTSTGRLSSKEPNLQQISKEADGKPWKDRIKKCFRARPGYVLLSADYSQLELRLAVAYAQEPELQKIFDEGRDIFTEMAKELGWARPKVKSFVYATQYGGGDARISYIFGVSLAKAKQLREMFYRKYPKFRRLDQACRASVAETRQLRLWSGRVRHFQRAEDSYKALNALLQGGAADVVERVWNHIMDTIDNEDCRVLLQVHDALVFEVREDLVEHYLPIIKATMSDVNGICAPNSAEPLFPVTFAVEVERWDGEPLALAA